MYMGHEGLYSSTTVYEQNPSCRVCSVKVKEVKVKADEKWGAVYEKLKNMFNLSENTNVIGKTDYLIMVGKGQQEIEYKKEYTMQKMLDEKEIAKGKYITVADDNKENPLKVRIVVE